MSLKAIGALKTAAILQEAIDRWPDRYVPKDEYKRRDTEEKINQDAKLFEDLDKRFYEYAEDLNKLNLEYIRKHRGEF